MSTQEQNTPRLRFSIHYHVPGMFTMMPLYHDIISDSEESALRQFKLEVPEGRVIHVSHDIPSDIQSIVNKNFMDLL